MLVCGLCLGCGSADIFKLERVGAPNLPEPPVASAKLVEVRRELAEFTARVLRQIYARGARAHDAVVGQAARAAEAVSGDLGSPARPLPEVDLPAPPRSAAYSALTPGPRQSQPVPGVEKALKRHAAEAADLISARYKYEGRLKDYARQPARTSWGLSSGMLRAYLVMAGLGIGLMAALRWAWRRRGALVDVVRGVSAFLHDEGVPAAAQAALKDALSKSEDRATEKVVAEIKASGK